MSWTYFQLEWIVTSIWNSRIWLCEKCQILHFDTEENHPDRRVFCKLLSGWGEETMSPARRGTGNSAAAHAFPSSLARWPSPGLSNNCPVQLASINGRSDCICGKLLSMPSAFLFYDQRSAHLTRVVWLGAVVLKFAARHWIKVGSASSTLSQPWRNYGWSSVSAGTGSALSSPITDSKQCHKTINPWSAMSEFPN